MKKETSNKFKKIISTGLAVTTIATSAGIAAKINHDAKEKRDTRYTIESGDTLTDISKKHYGTEIYYDEIAKYNNIDNPDMIKTGDTIKLPDLEKQIETYTILPGDTMTGICEKFYKDGTIDTANRLARYNKIDDVNSIKSGQVLNIPTYDDLLKTNAYPYSYELGENMK